ncbi:nucleolus protein [Punctularia strigosozonata HHB-11173 SS5]|uniref:nucleolus protein n=1 Tax=Punctularia strigosozonata (strain HHB-11173) TaxID=741275 RepID=UPI0004417BBE|nr:nucleolus protein [Punctularia strigosozonata HHB-11173 SS5]EIN07654.1 nucleolus protein [Punctularia strigosozonata HHB-11173 SS5]
MPKVRKRKVPVTRTSTNTSATKSPEATAAIIRRFHVLIKRRAQLIAQRPGRQQATLVSGNQKGKRRAIDTNAAELEQIDKEIEELGGLDEYQRMSTIGQGQDRGGGSERVLILWLQELGYGPNRPPGRMAGVTRLKLLEVGALKPDNYRSCQDWINATPMDLHSRHPEILEQDFLLMDQDLNRAQWDVISLSLVINFVPDAKERGKMLRIARNMLRPDGLLFLVLPLPCVANSRYLTFEHMQAIMSTLGFAQIKERWRHGGKMAYWLYQKTDVNENVSMTLGKKAVLRQGGSRNNFSILL